MTATQKQMTFTSHHTTSLLVASLFLVVMATLSHGVQGQIATPDDYNRLVNDTIHAYSNHLRPVINQNKAIDIFLTVNLLNLLDIDEVTQRMQLNAWFNFSWYDELRAWNASDYGGLNVIYPQPKDIWLPRVVVTNSIEKRDLFEDDYYPTIIFSSGVSRWYPGTIFPLICDLDVTYFPVDTQRCELTVTAMNYAPSVFLQFSEDRVRTVKYTSNGEWDFISHSTSQETIDFGAENEGFRQLTIAFTFKRRSLYYIINVLIPVMFLSFLSFFGFLIPDEADPMSFSVTVLLSITVYMTIMSKEVPPVSETFPYFQVYIFSLLILSLLSTVVIIIIVHLNYKDSFDHQSTDSASSSMDESNHENGQAVPSALGQRSDRNSSEVKSIKLERLSGDQSRRDNDQNLRATVDNKSVAPEIDLENDIDVNLTDRDVPQRIVAAVKMVCRSFIMKRYLFVPVFATFWILLTIGLLGKLFSS